MIDGLPDNIEELSDDEFLSAMEPDSPGSPTADPVDPAQVQTPVEEPVAPTPPPSGDGVVAPEAGAAEPTGAAVAGAAADPAPANPDPAPAGDPVAAAPEPAAEAGDEGGDPPNYEQLYQEIMKPFKANGKMIELRNPQEAIQLMQMGANYTRKMQQLQPHRKTVMMLENAQIDADRLSFLIDLDKGNPEALKKFLKDREIDPLDIDLTTAPVYLGGDHQVTDEQVIFSERLEELRSAPGGQDVINLIHTDWDTPSKNLLWENPEVLGVIHEQKESGVYDLIAAEIDRQKTLGTLRADIPFLEAYQKVGQQLVEAQAAATGTETPNATPAPAQTATPAPKVIGTSKAVPKSDASNNDLAAAASPSRGTPATQQNFVNPLAMPDDEFMAQMKDRV